MLSLEQIESSINLMDETYDANFGEWIRNEDNCRIVAYNMKKYVDRYPVSNVIVAIKWIVKDWTLKSIIIFSKKMLMDDVRSLCFKVSPEDTEKFDNRVKIISGLIYTWNPLFIAEFVLAITKYFTLEEKTKILKVVFEGFDKKKFQDVAAYLENKLESKVKKEVIKSGRKRKSQKRSKSIMDAYNIA